MNQLEARQTNDQFNPSWVQYEELRLARLQQQRQRMQNMKEVIEKYSAIIRQLSAKNNQLVQENEQYKLQSEQLLLENQEIRYKNQELVHQLSKQLVLNKNLKSSVRRMKEDISILTAEREYSQQANRMGEGSPNMFNYQVEYEVLQQLYEDIKRDYYSLTNQNQQLKHLVHLHSKQQAHHQSPREHIPKVASMSQLQSQKHREHRQNNKISQLKSQIINQELLIDKFRHTEKQQKELIQLLKNNMSKVCACHTGGVKSSKKIISAKTIEDKSKKDARD